MIGWAERNVIECAGIRVEDSTPEIERLATKALEECYYIDRAADWLWDRLESKRRYLY